MLPSDLRTLCFLEAFHIPRWVEERGGGCKADLAKKDKKPSSAKGTTMEDWFTTIGLGD